MRLIVFGIIFLLAGAYLFDPETFSSRLSFGLGAVFCALGVYKIWRTP